MKIKKILMLAVMALSILCCFNSFATYKSNDSRINNSSYCDICDSYDHDNDDCPYKKASAPDSDNYAYAGYD